MVARILRKVDALTARGNFVRERAVYLIPLAVGVPCADAEDALVLRADAGGLPAEWSEGGGWDSH